MSTKQPLLLSLLLSILPTDALHHMKRAISQDISLRDLSRSLVVTNMCQETVHPAIATQKGTAPNTGGFELGSGKQRNLTVGADWQGRVWGRTNCTFNFDGTGSSNNGGYNGGGAACATGDCGGVLDCKNPVCIALTEVFRGLSSKTYPNDQGNPPATLAEFSLASYSGQTFYDISLVDGYNIPMGIVSLYPESGNASLTEIPPNLTNPVCIGTAALLDDEGSTADEYLGTNSSFPIPLDRTQSKSDVQAWCPWDLQLSPMTGPSNGVYLYPDQSIQRPVFNPCYSACAKYSKPSDCCTGFYDSPSACKPSKYSADAKKVCPDAYSYAFDDQDSTFIIPSGGGFEVIFCPPGRSTTILSTLANQLHQLASTGHVSSQLLEKLRDEKIVLRTSNGVGRVGASGRQISWVAMVVTVGWLLIW